MKAHGELDARAAGQLVLAAQIVAVGGQIELARIGQTKAWLVQIVPRHEPLMPSFLGAVPMHGRRGLADRAVLLDLDCVGVADNQHRMRRARSSEATPGRLRAAITAAIDDDALALAAQFEGQHAGMRVPVKAVRRRLAGIDQHQRLARLQPLKTGMRGLRRRGTFRLRTGQHEVDHDAVFLDRIVEQREAAVAMAEEAQYRRHCLDRVAQRGWRLDAGGSQCAADIDQVAQYLKLN